MIISDFTNIELEYLRSVCNFVNDEKDIFNLRGQGLSIEEVAEVLELPIDTVKKISGKVNKKIKRIMQ